MQPREAITITLQDGSERRGTSWETSPMDVAKAVSKSLSERVVIAKVNVTIFLSFKKFLKSRQRQRSTTFSGISNDRSRVRASSNCWILSIQKVCAFFFFFFFPFV